jgi:hypothetical protein
MSAATFGAAVNCMDGRVQAGAVAFLRARYASPRSLPCGPIRRGPWRRSLPADRR